VVRPHADGGRQLDLSQFGFGHFVAHKPWRELLADYNIAAGRIWALVLLTTLLAPLIVARVRRIE